MAARALHRGGVPIRRAPAAVVWMRFDQAKTNQLPFISVAPWPGRKAVCRSLRRAPLPRSPAQARPGIRRERWETRIGRCTPARLRHPRVRDHSARLITCSERRGLPCPSTLERAKIRWTRSRAAGSTCRSRRATRVHAGGAALRAPGSVEAPGGNCRFCARGRSAQSSRLARPELLRAACAHAGVTVQQLDLLSRTCAVSTARAHARRAVWQGSRMGDFIGPPRVSLAPK